MASDSVGHCEHIAVKMHRGLGFSGSSGRECQQAHVVAKCIDICEFAAFGPHFLSQIRKVASLSEKTCRDSAAFQIIHQSVVTKRMADFAFARYLLQLLATQ